MAETATEPSFSIATLLPSYVVIVEVVAAAAALGFVRPVTTHEIAPAAASKARGVAKTIFKLGLEYDGVIVPVMGVPGLPPLVHVAVGVVPVKEAKPVTVIDATAVDDAPVNPTVTVERRLQQ